MPVSSSQLKTKRSSFSENNNEINKKLLQLIKRNDSIIEKRYSIKCSMIKSKPLPTVSMSADSDLLIERMRTYKFRSSNISSSQPIEMKYSGDRVYYYKLPAGKQIRDFIKNSLAADTNNTSRRRKELNLFQIEEPQIDYFADIRKRLASTFDKNPKKFPSSNVSLKLEKVSWNPLEEVKVPLYLSNPSTYFTTETGLSPENFTLITSSNVSLHHFPDKRIFEKREHNSFSSQINKTKLNLSKDIKSKLLDYKKEFKKFDRKKKLRYPIVPNNINVEESSTKNSILIDEEPSFILSLLYSESKIKACSKLFSRSFSGSLKIPYFGNKLEHRFYSGSFGYVDGITSLYKLSMLIANEETLNANFLMDPQGMSRESFLALSHMFNLRKLVGKPNLPIMDHFSQRTISENSLINSSYELLHGKYSKQHSESIDSFDFTLVHKFTDKIVNEQPPNESLSTKQNKTDELQYVTHKIINFYRTCRSTSSFPNNLGSTEEFKEPEPSSKSSSSSNNVESYDKEESTKSGSTESYVYTSPKF